MMPESPLLWGMNGVDRGLNIFEYTVSRVATIRVREETKRLLIKFTLERLMKRLF